MSATPTQSPVHAALGYRKFRAGSAPRMLVMHAKYHVVEDVILGARELGWEVAPIATPCAGTGDARFIAHLLRQLIEFQPDFLLSINHLGFDEEGALAGVLERFDVPLASWFVDHPLPILGGAERNARSNCQVFCFERTALPWLRKIGFEDPQHLPTGSNARHFHPSVIDENEALGYEHPLTLVAGSWWQKARVEPCAEIQAAANALRHEHKVDRKFVERRLESVLNASRGGPRRLAFHAAQTALAESSMLRRRDFVMALAPLRPVVYGDEHWRDLLPTVQLEGPVERERQLPALFRASSVNLNVTAAQMPTAVNQRVWDVPGAGGFLLTDAQEEVLTHFEDGVDVATYTSDEEALEKARFYLGRRDLRANIAGRAFEKIEAEHRTTHRLRTIEDVLRKRFA